MPNCTNRGTYGHELICMCILYIYKSTSGSPFSKSPSKNLCSTKYSMAMFASKNTKIRHGGRHTKNTVDGGHRLRNPNHHLALDGGMWKPKIMGCLHHLSTGKLNKKLLKMAIELVSFPINSMVIFHSYVSLPAGSYPNWGLT